MNRIKDLREDMDLRQIDVANATGIDQRTLSNYETGKTKPDSDALIRLADFFGVSIDYLVGRTGGRRRKEIAAKLDELKRSIDEVKKLL